MVVPPPDPPPKPPAAEPEKSLPSLAGPPESVPAVDPEGESQSFEQFQLSWRWPGVLEAWRLVSPTLVSVGLHLFLLLVFLLVLLEKRGLYWPMIETLAQPSDLAGVEAQPFPQDFPVHRLDDRPPKPATDHDKDGSGKFPQPNPTPAKTATDEVPPTGLTDTVKIGPDNATGRPELGTATGQLARLGFQIDAQQAYRLTLAETGAALVLVPEPGVDLEPLLNREVQLDGYLGPIKHLRGQILIATRINPAPAQPKAAPAAVISVQREVIGGVMPPEVVENILDVAKVKPGELVVDVGGGDGRIVAAAARKYRARGLDYALDDDADQLEDARYNMRALGVEKLVAIERADLSVLDLSQADVVCLRVSQAQIDALLPQLQKMKPGSRIVTHRYPVSKAIEDDYKWVRGNEGSSRFPTFGDRRVYFYTAPLHIRPVP